MVFSLRVTNRQQVVTLVVRLLAFTATLAPLLSLLLPWVMLDGNRDILSGIGLAALLASPMREYLYQVDPLQAAILTIGPILIALLAIITSNSYYRRKSIFWAPLTMLAIAMAIAFIAGDLINTIYEGLVVVIAVAILLILHQAAICLQVFLSNKRKLRRVSNILAIATGIGYYRWSES